MMITADDARKLAGVHEEEVEAFLNAAENQIRQAAQAGKRFTIVRDTVVCNAGYTSQSKGPWKTVRVKLEAEGFKVSFFYEERQFVDIGMKISW